MFCEICKTAANIDKSISKRNIFSEGCFFLRLESIKIHEFEPSANHIKATRIMSAKSEPTKTPVYKMIAYLNKETLEKLSKS